MLLDCLGASLWVELHHVEYSIIVTNVGHLTQHPYKLMLEHCDNNSQKQVLSQRIAKIWNSLPAAAIDFTNLVSFKASLQNINLCIFTRF